MIEFFLLCASVIIGIIVVSPIIVPPVRRWLKHQPRYRVVIISALTLLGAFITLVVIVRVFIAFGMAFEYVQAYNEAEANSEAFRIRNGQINHEATLQSFLWPFMGGRCFTFEPEICKEAKRQSINLWRFPPSFDELRFMWFWPMTSAIISFTIGWTLTTNYPSKSNNSS